MSRELVVGAHDLVLREGARLLGRESFGAEEGSLPSALQRLLPQRPPAPISVRVSASHARMWLLPWFAQLTRPERWASLAASRFEQTFGEPADGWAVRVADDLPPRARLAAALPESLLALLQAAARLRALRIALLEALGALLEREPAFSGCVAQIEPDRACMLLLWRGELRRVRTRRFDAIEDLAAAVRSEWIFARGQDAGSPADGSAVAVLGAVPGAAASLATAVGCSRVLELA